MTIDEFKAETARKIDNWIVALEKGDIRPFKSYLSNETGTAMCCLGVYLHSLGRARREKVFNDGGENVTTFPSSRTMAEIGLTQTGELRYGVLEFPPDVSRNASSGTEIVSLSQLNDWTAPEDFGDIIKVIKFNKERMIEIAAHDFEFEAGLIKI